MDPLRWGIAGLGRIAHSFVKDLQLAPGNILQAVASRSAGNAAAFASEYGVGTHYGNYQELFADPEVDIVYVGTTHESHAGLSIAAMNAGKHVLCEKPLAVQTRQVQAMIEASRANGVFLMEALWSRFNPAIVECLNLVRDGVIGEVSYLHADFCFPAKLDANARLLNMDMAGGALLDIGIYPIFLAYSVFGKPREILATSRFHETGADLQTSVVLKYDDGMASTMSSFLAGSDMVARIYGSHGSIYIHPRWHEATGYTLLVGDREQKINRPKRGKGFTYEIEECMRCIAAGKTQSDRWSHEHSLDLIGMLDEVRRQVGLRYPFE
jgi:predicted dehydrogenase